MTLHPSKPRRLARQLPLLLVLGGCAPRPSLPAPAAGQAATKETFTVASRALGEVRTINVYLPPGYGASRRRFPVVYMPDGGLDEDFPHVTATIDSLIRLGRVAPVLVVGIPNTERRRDLTGPTTVAADSAIAPHVGGSAAFRRFLRDELLPEVRRRYRATDATTIVGESLAGLFIIETFLEEPALFRRYIALSPSLWWNDRALLRRAASAGAALARAGRGRVLFLSAANESIIAEGTAELARELGRAGRGGPAVHYVPRPDLTHATIYAAMAPTAFLAVLDPAPAGR